MSVVGVMKVKEQIRRQRLGSLAVSPGEFKINTDTQAFLPEMRTALGSAVPCFLFFLIVKYM